MKTTVYISSSCIQAVCGNCSKGGFKALSWHSAKLRPDAVVNGVVINESAVKSGFDELKAKLGAKAFSKVNIVVDSVSVLTKKIQTPSLSRDNMLKFVESEFADVSDVRDALLYDYMPLGGKGAGFVLASAAEKSFIEGYVNLFRELDIKIESIDVAAASVVRLAKTKDIRSKTCILAALDTNSVNLALFVGGDLKIFNHARFYSTFGSGEFANEITQLISSLSQFNAAQKTGADISDVYFAGSTVGDGSSEIVSLCEYVTTSLQIRTQLFPQCAEISTDAKTAFPTAQYFYCAGNLLGY
ncbi:MAG: hypothetical protein RSE36_00925 [Oscillospiraceae bacterium]